MAFSVGKPVVISVFGKYQIGKVSQRRKTKTGYVYHILAEDGRTHENCHTKHLKSESVYIVPSMTKKMFKDE